MVRARQLFAADAAGRDGDASREEIVKVRVTRVETSPGGAGETSRRHDTRRDVPE